MSTSSAVRSLPDFAHLSRAEARVLGRNLDLLRLEPDQSVLLSPGPAQELLLVVEGRLAALAARRWVAGPGAVLGAQALMTRSPQPHGFRALGPALVAYAGVAQARALMSGSPAFATAVAVALSEELGRRAVGQASGT